MRWLAIALVLTATSASASAEPWLAVGAGGGGRFGKVDSVQLSGGDVGVVASVQLADAVSVVAGYERAWISGIDHPARGKSDIATIALHDVIFGFDGAPETVLAGDLFVEAGVGREATTWAGGEHLDRGLVALAIGGTVRIARHPWQAIRYGARFDIMHEPDPGKVPALCDGPCDQATKTAPFGVSTTMEVLWLVGF